MGVERSLTREEMKLCCESCCILENLNCELGPDSVFGSVSICVFLLITHSHIKLLFSKDKVHILNVLHVKRHY